VLEDEGQEPLDEQRRAGRSDGSAEPAQHVLKASFEVGGDDECGERRECALRDQDVARCERHARASRGRGHGMRFGHAT